MNYAKPIRHLAVATMIMLFAFSISALAQTTINVPADQPTIQAAIDVAQNGDTVLVAPGTYYENINFRGKAITVKSSDGPSATIIDGSANGSVVTFNSGESSDAVLSGFTIQNGWSTWGAGIEISDSSPIILGNTIKGNQGETGLGIDIGGGSPQNPQQRHHREQRNQWMEPWRGRYSRQHVLHFQLAAHRWEHDYLQ